MANAETLTIIQPLFDKLEECLDLNPILGKMFSEELFKFYHMQELQSLKDNRIDQNRAFLSYLLTQPVQQVKKFGCILQGDIGNASHHKLAAEILVAFPLADPWKRISSLLLTVANHLSQTPDTCAICTEALRETMDQYKMSFPQQPRLFLIHLLLAMEVIAGITDITPVRGEILRVYQSLDW